MLVAGVDSRHQVIEMRTYDWSTGCTRNVLRESVLEEDECWEFWGFRHPKMPPRRFLNG